MALSLDRFQPPTMAEQRQQEYIPCAKCKEVTNYQALDVDGLCPDCHNEEDVCREEYRIGEEDFEHEGGNSNDGDTGGRQSDETASGSND